MVWCSCSYHYLEMLAEGLVRAQAAANDLDVTAVLCLCNSNINTMVFLNFLAKRNHDLHPLTIQDLITSFDPFPLIDKCTLFLFIPPIRSTAVGTAARI